MVEVICASPFFGLGLSAVCWCFGVWAQNKTRSIFCNPLIIAGALIVLVLVGLDIPLADYNAGGDMIKLMLGPVTAVLALNIYNQRLVLREYFLPVLAGCLAGSLASLGFVLLLCRLLSVEELITASLLPKSVTTAIAVGIAESRGGVQGLAAAAVALAGTAGALFAPLFARMFRITDPVAEGVAIGACSHALGTSKAMEIGPVQGAMSSIALCVCGIFTSVLVLFF